MKPGKPASLQMEPTCEKAEAAVVLTKSFLEACHSLGLDRSSVLRCLGMPEATLKRYESQERFLQPESREWELAAMLVTIHRFASSLVGNDPVLLKSWASTYNRALKSTPIEALASAQGLVAVCVYLQRVASHD